MAPDKPQLLRLVFIDRKIREGMASGRLANSRTMAAEYEVSYKSIQRDIDYLKHQLDAPIAYDSRRRGYYYTEANYSLPALSLSESDLFAICIADQALQQYRDTPIYQRLQRVFDKITAALPERVEVTAAHLEERFRFKGVAESRIDPVTWERVSEATRRSRRLEIVYQKPGGAPGRRKVDPYRMIRYQGQWYLRGWCHRRQRPATFALSRIHEAVVLDEAVTWIPAMDEEEGGFGIYSGPARYQVRVRVAPAEAPFVRERVFHPEQRLTPLADGWLQLEFPASHLAEVERWVLSWGEGMVVEEPAELRERIRARLAALSRLYQEKA